MWGTAHLKGGPRRVNHAACEVDGMIFTFGGYCASMPFNRSNRRRIDVFVFNTHSLKWTELPMPERQAPPEDDPTPFRRYGHTVVAHNRRIYLYGGRDDLGPGSQVHVFHVDSLRWDKPVMSGGVPSGRDGHSACVIGNRMYVFGGYVDTLDRMDNSVHSLDLETFDWRTEMCRGAVPQPLDFHTATAFGHRMVVWGGRAYETPYSETEVYSSKLYYLDTETHIWHEVQPISRRTPIGRRSHAAVNFHGELLIFGGYESRYQQHFNEFWRFNLNSLTWTKVFVKGITPCARRRAAMCHVNGKVFIFGGTSPYKGPPLYFPPKDDEVEGEEPHHALDDDRDHTLLELDDMHVIEESVSLRSLCLQAVIRHRLSRSTLPYNVVQDLDRMTKRQNISAPLMLADPGQVIVPLSNS